MAVSPLIPQGTINRLRASITIPNYSQLNITAPFLTQEMIAIAPEGDVTTAIQTATGVVNSPEPYQILMVTAHIAKTTPLANAWKAQIEAGFQTPLGEFNVLPDTSSLGTYNLLNGSVAMFRDLNFDGKNAEYTLVLRGVYIINNAMWNLT